MPEVQIPKELQNEIEKFNAAQQKGDRDELVADTAIDNAKSGTMERQPGIRSSGIKEQSGEAEEKKKSLIEKIKGMFS